MLLGIDASRAVSDQRTGTEAYAFFLLRALLPLAGERGHRVRLYYNQPPPDHLFPDFTHVEQRIIPMARLWTQVRLARELRENPPDLFFTPAHVIPFTYRGRSVVTLHDLGFHHFPNAHTRGQLAYLKLSTRLNGRAAERVIVDSQATRTDLIRFHAVDPEKVDVVYPGIDPDLAQVTDRQEISAVQEKYGIQSPYLLAIGTIQPRKNLVRLAQAFTSNGLPHQLVLAGKVGWKSQPIIDEIERIKENWHDQILLPGFVAENDKAALISGAEALLFPSLYEGFGFPVLEGQACATPVLASNSSSLPEIAGEGALFVDPTNVAEMAKGIRRVVEDIDLRDSLMRAGLENVGRFSWQKAAQGLLNTMEKAGSLPYQIL